MCRCACVCVGVHLYVCARVYVCLYLRMYPLCIWVSRLLCMQLCTHTDIHTCQHHTPTSLQHVHLFPHHPSSHPLTPPSHPLTPSSHPLIPPSHPLTPPSHPLTPPSHPLTPFQEHLHTCARNPDQKTHPSAHHVLRVTPTPRLHADQSEDREAFHNQ